MENRRSETAATVIEFSVRFHGISSTQNWGIIMNSFGAKSTIKVENQEYDFFSLEKAEQAGAGPVSRLPFSLKVMLENLLRHEDSVSVSAADVRAVAGSTGAAIPDKEIAFRPARVLMQDFTGVPAIVDLATMRDV